MNQSLIKEYKRTFRQNFTLFLQKVFIYRKTYGIIELYFYITIIDKN